MTSGTAEPKPIIPALGGLYEISRDLSWPLVRIGVGAILIAHGINKRTSLGVAAFAARTFAARGIEPALFIACLIIFVELVGGLCISIGLFTRFFAAAAAIELLVIILLVAGPRGFFNLSTPGGGWVFFLLWGLMAFAIALRGGGPYSVDRKIGWEL